MKEHPGFLPTAGAGAKIDQQWLGIYDAQVSHTNDPTNQGRVRLFVPQVLGNTTSAWATSMQPGLTPAVGQPCYVHFLGGNPDLPQFFVGLTSKDIHALSSTTGLVQNANPYFVGNTITPWSAVNGTVQAIQPNPDTNPPFVNGIQLNSNGTGGSTITEVLQPLPAGPTQPFQVTGWVYYPVGGDVQIGMGFQDNSNNFLNNQVTSLTVPAGKWTLLQTVVNSPPTAGFGYPIIGPTTSTTNQQFTATAVQVVGQIPGSLIQNSSIGASKIAVGTVVAGIVDATTVEAATLISSTILSYTSEPRGPYTQSFETSFVVIANTGSSITPTRDQASNILHTDGTSNVLTWPSNPTAGAKVLVAVNSQAPNPITSVIDNGTSPTTFTRDKLISDSNGTTAIYRADNITLPASGGYTVTISYSAGHSCTAMGQSYLGVATGGPSSSNSNSGTASPISCGQVTGSAGAVFFGACHDDTSANPAHLTLAGGNFNSLLVNSNTTKVNNNVPPAAATCDLIGSGTLTASWTTTDSITHWYAAMCVYPAATPVTNGVALTVKVLTGQANVQNGITNVSSTANPAELAITPSATGSWIYGAAQVAANSTFTAAGTTTFSQNVADATNTSGYGTFRSTSTTTSGTQVTIGATAPNHTNQKVALAEILASSTLVEDASSPAGVNTTSAQTVQTGVFTPPSGSLLVAMVSANPGTATALTTQVTSIGPNTTWTQIATDSTNAASIWIAAVPAISGNDWIANSSASSATPSTDWSSLGGNSLKITANGGANPGAVSPFFATMVGDTVSFSVDVFTVATLNNITTAINYYDTTQTTLLGTTTNGPNIATANQQQTITLQDIVTPVGSAFFQLTVYDAATDANGTLIYIDNVLSAGNLAYSASSVAAVDAVGNSYASGYNVSSLPGLTNAFSVEDPYGRILATMGGTGTITGTTISANTDLLIAGQSWSNFILPGIPTGIVAFTSVMDSNLPTSTFTNTTALSLFELDTAVSGGRQYLITLSTINFQRTIGTTAGNINVTVYYTTDGSTPSTSSSKLMYWNGPVGTAGVNTAVPSMPGMSTTYSPNADGTLKMLVTTVTDSNSNTVKVVAGPAVGNGNMTVTDLGPAAFDNGLWIGTGGGTGSSKQTYTTKYYPTNSWTYAGGDGSPPNALHEINGALWEGSQHNQYGSQYAFLEVDNIGIQSDLSGATLHWVKLTLHNLGCHYASGGLVELWGNSHTHVNSYNNGRTSLGSAVHINNGATQTYTMPNSLVTSIQSGAYKSIQLGPGPSGDLNYDLENAGVTTGGNRPYLTINYTK